MTAQKPMTAHVRRYLRRVDAHLPALADDAARAAFLRHQRDVWVTRYEAFQGDVDSRRPTGGEDACDYVETIAELDRRLSETTCNSPRAAA
jgi:hypothetical protein